jgi:hypothetical protein
MRVGLQLLRGGFGVLGVLAAGKALDLSTDGASHETISYLASYGAAAFFAALVALTSVVLNRREHGGEAAGGPSIRNSSAGRDIVQTAVTHHHHSHAPPPPKRKKVDAGAIQAGEAEVAFTGARIWRLLGRRMSGLRIIGIPIWNESEDPEASISNLKAFVEVHVIEQSDEARRFSEDWEKGPNVPKQKRHSRPPRIRPGDRLDQGAGRWRELPPKEFTKGSGFPGTESRPIDLDSDMQRHTLDVLAAEVPAGRPDFGWRLAVDPIELSVISHPLLAGRYRVTITLRSPDLRGPARFAYEMTLDPGRSSPSDALPELVRVDPPVG